MVFKLKILCASCQLLYLLVLLHRVFSTKPRDWLQRHLKYDLISVESDVRPCIYIYLFQYSTIQHATIEVTIEQDEQG